MSKIVLGTMKLKKYFNTSRELAIFLSYAHNEGIRQLHVSSEYDSYNLLVKSIKKLNKKKFTFILKLPESKNDQVKFSIKRFMQKINKYRKDLGKKHIFIIQLVNRYKCKNRKEYLLYEEKIFDTVKNMVIKLKKFNLIKSFYFFPYFENESKIRKYKFITGITVYRNPYEKQNDNYAKQNKFKIIAMRIFGGDKRLLNNKNLKKLIMFNLKNKLVSKVIVGANNKAQLDELLKVC